MGSAESPLPLDVDRGIGGSFVANLSPVHFAQVGECRLLVLRCRYGQLASAPRGHRERMDTMSRAGSVKRDDSGRWGFVVDLSPPGAATRKQVRRRGFRTKAEAVTALDEVKGTIRTGRYAGPSRLTLAGYLHQWLDGRAAAGLKPSTVDSYRRSVGAYVNAHPGGRCRCRLSPRSTLTGCIALCSRAAGVTAGS